MMDKYLPIGSVVLLKNAKRRIMITGIQQFVSKTEKLYDYCGVLFPEGVVINGANLYFNHEDIDKLYALGHVDNEVINFQNVIKELVGNKTNEELRQEMMAKKESLKQKVEEIKEENSQEKISTQESTIENTTASTNTIESTQETKIESIPSQDSNIGQNVTAQKPSNDFELFEI